MDGLGGFFWIGVAFGNDLDDSLFLFALPSPGHAESFATVENGGGRRGFVRGVFLPAEIEDVKGFFADAGFELLERELFVGGKLDDEGRERHEFGTGSGEAGFGGVSAGESCGIFAGEPLELKEAPKGVVVPIPKDVGAGVEAEHLGDGGIDGDDAGVGTCGKGEVPGRSFAGVRRGAEGEPEFGGQN